MKTYSDFVQYYEDIFPFREKTYFFLKNYLLPDFNSILDIGCGTGVYISKFGLVTEYALGIDSDAEMISYAKDNYPGAEFRKMDMMQIQSLNTNFDLIYSIGNVIPHIPKELLEKLAEQIYGNLKSGGRFIFQTVNWDSVLEKGLKKFKVIEKREKSLKFYREYRNITKEKITFYLRLEKSDKIIFEEEQFLFPAPAEEYIKIFTSAGFTLKDHLGNFEKNPFEKLSSPANIFVFEKTK